MSAFLRAKENIDDVQVTPRYRGLFQDAMHLFHMYFKKNKLYDVIDLDKFFDMYLFKSTYPNNTKLKISKAKAIIPPFYTGVFIHKNTCKILLVERKDQDFDNPENYTNYLSTLMHEFIHFITLYGKMTIKMEDGKTKELPMFDNHNRDEYNHYVQINQYFEPLTEMMALKILSECGLFEIPSYSDLVKSMNFIGQVFDIQFDKSFLQRNMNDFFKKLSSEHSINILLNLRPLFELEILKKNVVDATHYPLYVITDAVYEYYELLVNNKISTTDFIQKQSNLYHFMPDNIAADNKEFYNALIDDLNIHFVLKVLNDNNLPENEENVRRINDILVKGIGYQHAIMYANDFNADYAVRINLAKNVEVETNNSKSLYKRRINQYNNTLDKRPPNIYASYVVLVTNTENDKT